MSGDGRMFGWQRVRGGIVSTTPVIIWDRLYGCAKMEFVGDLHLMKPHQYDLTLAELAAEYPVPVVTEE